MSEDFDFEDEDSPLAQAAVSMHELYVTLKNAGFSRRDAIELISRVMIGTIAAPENYDSEED